MSSRASTVPDVGYVVSRSPPLQPAPTSYKDLNARFGPWTKFGLDRLYGPKQLINNIFGLGNKEIQFIDNVIHIGGDTRTYPVTDGLID